MPAPNERRTPKGKGRHDIARGSSSSSTTRRDQGDGGPRDAVGGDRTVSCGLQSHASCSSATSSAHPACSSCGERCRSCALAKDSTGHRERGERVRRVGHISQYASPIEGRRSTPYHGRSHLQRRRPDPRPRGRRAGRQAGNLPARARPRSHRHSCKIERTGRRPRAARADIHARSMPLSAADRVLAQLTPDVRCIFVDAHAEATADKYLLAHHLRSRVGRFGNSYSRPDRRRAHPAGGTAFICDVGMTGPYDGILGRRADRVPRPPSLLCPRRSTSRPATSDWPGHRRSGRIHRKSHAIRRVMVTEADVANWEAEPRGTPP